MTEAKPRRRRPAFASRILTFGLSFALTLGLIGGWNAAARRISGSSAARPPAARPLAAEAPPQRIVVRVVQVRPKQVRAPVRVVRRYHYVARRNSGGGSGRVTHTVSHGS